MSRTIPLPHDVFEQARALKAAKWSYMDIAERLEIDHRGLSEQLQQFERTHPSSISVQLGIERTVRRVSVNDPRKPTLVPLYAEVSLPRLACLEAA